MPLTPIGVGDTAMNSIFDNWYVLLGIAGAAVSLSASITDKLSGRKKTRMLLMLAVLGFLVFTVQQLLQSNLDATREKLIDQIRTTVTETREIVGNLAARLKDLPLDALGSRLFTIEDDPQAARAMRIEAMAKGSVSTWETYASWLSRTKQEAGVAPSLSLTVNGSHYYLPGLVQAFLLTDSDSGIRSAIRAVISGRPKDWEAFPNENFVHDFGLAPRSVKYVLFFDGSSTNLIGYAEAGRFVEELYAKQRLGLTEHVKSLLNDPVDADRLAKEFLSFEKAVVVAQTDIAEIIQTMLKQDASEVVVTEQRGRYLVKLLKLVRVAEKKRAKESGLNI